MGIIQVQLVIWTANPRPPTNRQHFATLALSETSSLRRDESYLETVLILVIACETFLQVRKLLPDYDTISF